MRREIPWIETIQLPIGNTIRVPGKGSTSFPRGRIQKPKLNDWNTKYPEEERVKDTFDHPDALHWMETQYKTLREQQNKYITQEKLG